MEEHFLENDMTVYKALNYETNSPLAKMIRRRALELGGREWVTADEIGALQGGAEAVAANEIEEGGEA